MRQALVVLNPLAGSSDVDRVREVVARAAAGGLHCNVHIIAPTEPVTAAVRAAAPGNSELVAAAGGDGTVSAMA